MYTFHAFAAPCVWCFNQGWWIATDTYNVQANQSTAINSVLSAWLWSCGVRSQQLYGPRPICVLPEQFQYQQNDTNTDNTLPRCRCMSLSPPQPKDWHLHRFIYIMNALKNLERAWIILHHPHSPHHFVLFFIFTPSTQSVRIMDLGSSWLLPLTHKPHDRINLLQK